MQMPPELDPHPQLTGRRASPSADPLGRGLAELHVRYCRLRAHADPHVRGILFEGLIFDLLDHAGLEPRRSYLLRDEQIDGSFVFGASVFLLETKWISRPLTREHADLFASKLRRKGRNTLGLIISVRHFSRGFLRARHDGGTPFIAINGDDLEDVLSTKIDLHERLRLRRRHLAETGEPWSATYRA